MKIPKTIKISGLYGTEDVHNRVAAINEQAKAGAEAAGRIEKKLRAVLESSGKVAKFCDKIDSDSGKIYVNRNVWEALFNEQPEKFTEMSGDLDALRESHIRYDVLHRELVDYVRRTEKDDIAKYIAWTQEGGILRWLWRGRYVTWERLGKIIDMLDTSHDSWFVTHDGKGDGVLVEPRPEHDAQYVLRTLLAKKAKEPDKTPSQQELPVIGDSSAVIGVIGQTSE